MSELKKIIDNNMCSGCGLCATVLSTKMRFNSDGYLRPIIESVSKDEETKILKACPSNIYDVPTNDKNIHQKFWGPSIQMLLSYSTNNTIRHKGSSGGTITATLKYLIEENIIDGVVHIGSSKKNPMLNEVSISYSVEEIINKAGSRYSPAAPLESILQMIQPKKRYAFVGKPCDVYAIRKLSEIDPNLKEQFVYMFSFFCAGTPSIEGTNKILESFNIDEKDVTSFQYRGNGWPGYTKAITKDNKEYTMEYNDSWGKILNRYLQPRCKVCLDGIGEFADIAFADGWETDEKGYPIFKEQEGMSITISRTVDGDQLLKRMVEEKHIKVHSVLTDEDINKIQPYQHDRRKYLTARLIPMKIMRKSTVKYSSKYLINLGRGKKLKHYARTFAGTLYRIYRNRI